MAPLLFGGSSHPDLAAEVAHLLGTVPGKIDRRCFPDNELYIRILEPTAKKDTFILQSTAFNPNTYLMEILLMADALKRMNAQSISLILPYYGYARQDRVEIPGEAISAKVVADLLTRAGIKKIITLDLHSSQIEGFFDIPMDHPSCSVLLIPYLKSLDLEDLTIVAPDKGAVKIASVYADSLKAPMALIDKERLDPFTVRMRLFIGDVKGRTVLLPDDMCATGATLLQAAEECARKGAKKIFAAISHGLFLGDALDDIASSPIETLITTNSVPTLERVRKHPKIRVLSIAPLIAQAMQNSY